MILEISYLLKYCIVRNYYIFHLIKTKLLIILII